MKKYLPGMFSIIFAISLIALINPRKALTYRFNITALPSTAQVVEQITSHSSGDYYSNWQISGSASCPGADEQACTLVVDSIYTHLIGLIRVLNAEDIGLWGTETLLKFPMSVGIGYDDANNVLDRYKVTTSNTTNIQVTNKVHN